MRSVEKKIGLLSEVSLQVTQIESYIEQLDSLLIDERRAVSKSDLIALESLVIKKNDVADGIQLCIETMRSIFGELGKIDGKGILQDLSDLLDRVDELTVDDQATSVEQELLHHLRDKLKRTGSNLIKKRTDIQPRIEANRYLTEKLLKHHRETYRFWQGVLSESESTYGAHGKAKAASSSAIIRVKT